MQKIGVFAINYMSKSTIISLLILVFAAGIVLMRYGIPGITKPSVALAGQEIEIHKTPTCGCCGNYVGYAERFGLNTQVKNHDDLSPIKDQFGIPLELQSCHTSVIGGYVVEGHIPLEVVEKLLTEKPEIKGIAMPGMPAGSPGMPGTKTGPFEIHELRNDGSTSIYLSM